MGWFLQAKQETKNKRTQRGKSEALPLAGPGHLWGPSIKFFLCLVLVSALGVGWFALERTLLDYAANPQVNPLSFKQVQLVDAPDSIDRYVRLSLKRAIAAQIKLNQTSTGNLDNAVKALKASPWVQQVIRMSRTHDGHILVKALYRTPSAIVQIDHGYVRVDDHSVQLPGLFTAGQLQALKLPVITGVSETEPGAGKPWQSDDLAQGLELAQLLQNKPYTKQIRHINVSQHDTQGRTRLVIHTRLGQVRWGLGPWHGQSIEPNTAIKLRRVQYVFTKRRAIDAGGQIVSIYGPQIYITDHNTPPRAIATRYHN